MGEFAIDFYSELLNYQRVGPLGQVWMDISKWQVMMSSAVIHTLLFTRQGLARLVACCQSRLIFFKMGWCFGSETSEIKRSTLI